LATWIQGASSYRFTISGSGLSTPVVVTNNYRGFGWTQVPGYQLGSTYTVTVSLAFGGSTTFGTPGSSCTVTPAAPTVTTSLESSFCGQSVDASQTVLATWIQGATSYRFTISGTGLSTPVVVTNNYRGFTWSQVAGYQLGTSYTVTVAIAFGGSTTFGTPGSSCTVTPTGSSTSLTTATCTTMQYYQNASPVITANAVPGAVAYRFKFVGGNPSPMYYYSSTSSLDMFTSGVPLGDYSVSVAFATSAPSGTLMSNYSYSADGSACTIKYSASAPTMALSDDTAMNSLTAGEEETQSNVSVNEEESTLSEELWSVRASTNPYEENFFLRLDNANGLSSDAVFTVRILDLQGKLIEQRSVVASGLEEERYGDGLSSGMYLVTLTDGTRQQTIRVVKK
jgi:hypothetical protein